MIENKKTQIKNRLYDLFVLFIDISFSIVGIILATPILIVVGVLIKMEDGGPVIYRQERVGKNEKIFKIYKIRSMKVDADKYGDKWAEKNDNRITKIGNIIRKSRIDELPQFINVLKRDMSIIGPRPEVLVLTKKFDKEIDGFINRLKIRPGITGWAQVNGGYDLSPRTKYEKDMYYIEHRNMKLDFIIILKTISVIVSGHGAR